MAVLDKLNAIIINADDFGLEHDVNRAIVDSFRTGLCSSTTLIANLPGFYDACQLSHENKITDRIGLHLNLGEGFPLIDDVRKSRKFCNGEGQLKLSSNQCTLFLEVSDAQLLANEIRAQIVRCRKMGIPLTHVDSHRHLHVQWAILRVLLLVAKDEGIPYVRIPRNCGRGIGMVKAIYKHVITREIAKRRMRRTIYFGSIADYLWLKKNGPSRGPIEIMVHPRYTDGGVICDYPSKLPLVQELQEVEGYHDAVPFTQH
jgi:predicted glycoside hydrolase/deacetylase ChbG (UPF0249 family)